MIKKSFLVVLFFLSYINSKTQVHYYHNLSWERITLSDKISSKLKCDLQLQVRTQSTPKDNYNFFKFHHIYTYSVWLNYELTKNFKVFITPFCYFNTVSLFPQSKDAEGRSVNEYRWAIQPEHTFNLKSLSIANRLGAELRYRDLKVPDNYISNIRTRYRLKFDIPLKKESPLSFTLFDEIFIEFGSPVKNDNGSFNQNRFYTGFNYKLSRNIKLSLAYMNVWQKRASANETDNSNVIWGIISFDNIFSQFGKKNPEPAEK